PLMLIDIGSVYGANFKEAPEELYFALDEIVSVVSRIEEKRSEAPGTVLVITRDEIRERGYRDLVDLLKDCPGFDIQERIGGQDGGTYVIPRGIWGNNKVQVLLNGVPLNPMNGTHIVFGHHLSLWHLKQVEILYGPASAVYGADAFSAVINMVTDEPQKRPDELELSYQMANHDTFESYGLFSKKFGEDSGASLYIHGFRTNDFNLRDEYKNHRIDNGFGLKTPIYELDKPYETPEQDLDIYFDSKFGHWRLFGEYLGTRQPNNIQTIFYTGRSQLKKDKAELRTLALALENLVNFSDYFFLKSLVNYQYYILDPDSDYGRYSFDNYIFERSKAVEWREQLQWKGDEGTDLSLGFAVRRVSAFPYINSRTPFDEGTKYEDFPIIKIQTLDDRIIDIPPIVEREYWSYGLFSQLTRKISDSVKGVVGIRYDWDTFNHENSFNPRIGLIIKPWEKDTFKLLYGTAFISPSPYFRYKEWLGTNYAHLPPDVMGTKLKPERLKTFEIAYIKRLNFAELNISAFYSITKDAIQEAGAQVSGNTLYLSNGEVIDNAVIEYPINSGKQRTFGIDLLFTGRVSKCLSYRAWYSFINARTKLMGKTFDAPKVSTHKFGFGLTLRPSNSLLMNLRTRWWSGIHTQPGNPLFHGGKIKGKCIVDAHLSYKTPIKRVEFTLDAKNLLNVDYFTAGAQSEDHRFGGSLPLIPQRPREIYFGLTYIF
ncbi:TonB-dependent receptor plug domain-containing protein, partial [Dissulfuribacter thermophilus]